MIDKTKTLTIEGLDEQCVSLVGCLNKIDGVETVESCCGHLKDLYRIWFRCNDFSVLARLSRSVDRRYSDGSWRIEACSSDVKPLCQFLLSSTRVFCSYREMEESVAFLIENIGHWQGEEFDGYFSDN